MYPGLVASLRENDGVDGDGDGARTGSPAGVSLSSSSSSSLSLSLSGSVAGEIIYPKAVEAFLSTTDRPPCSKSASGRILTAAAAMKTSSTSTSTSTSNGSSSPVQRSCRCYEETGTTGDLSGRCHDPREALEALRPASRSPPHPPHRTDSTPGDSSRGNHGRGGSGEPGSSGKGGADDSDVGSGEPAMAVAVDPLGAVLLLCEVLRSEERVSAVGAVGPRLQRECCGWVLDHLAALFPDWIEAASTAGDVVDADAGRSSGQGLASALCDEIATALGLFVYRRALNGEFQEAQARLGARRVVCSHLF